MPATAPNCAAYYFNALFPFTMTLGAPLAKPYIDWATATLEALPQDQQLAALGPMQREMQVIVPADQMPGLGNANWHAVLAAMAARYDEACHAVAGLPPIDPDAIYAAAESINAK